MDAHRRTCQVFNRRIAFLKASSPRVKISQGVFDALEVATRAVAKPEERHFVTQFCRFFFYYVFRLSVVSLFETIEGMGKPEERHFVTAVLAGVSVCSVLL